MTRNTLADFERCRINFILNLLQYLLILLHHARSLNMIGKINLFLYYGRAVGTKLLKKTMLPNGEMRAGMVIADYLFILSSKSLIVNFCASEESLI